MKPVNNHSFDHRPADSAPHIAAPAAPENSAASASQIASPVESPSGPGLNPAQETPSLLSHLASVVLLATESIDAGDSPNRLESSFETDEFFQLAESILHRGGNVQAIAVRELAPEEISPGSVFRYRLISGARRLRACAMYKLPVRAIVQNAQYTDELVERLIENHLREPLSPYELGRQLQHIIETNQSISRRELARLVGLDVSVVQKAIDIAALPQPVIAAFNSAAEIQYRDAKILKDAVSHARDSVIACAETLKGQDIPSKEVIGQLIQAAEAAAATALTNGQAPGVEPFNTLAKPLSIEVDGRALGSFAVDKKGLPQIQLALPLTPRQQADLAKLIEKFLRTKVLHPAARKPTDKKAEKEILVVATNQPAANDSQGTVEERA